MRFLIFRASKLSNDLIPRFRSRGPGCEASPSVEHGAGAWFTNTGGLWLSALGFSNCTHVLASLLLLLVVLVLQVVCLVQVVQQVL